ncbi:MAG TPA: tRNA (guanosine(37)-N1)-methyltransferase TrmD [Thermodesulfobacteriota bacterium]|nr:tRNA (guanosine(37)-N1)-methyltransferase TrmD [Deltaproteobacteria bacterium]HNU71649.1 tRNA (guanosine(37)-N1)-methyltransferase TrmD [Thermodesulfobacteriota bacterium]HQO77661.1 tRNA (guanosine(37)-N1)-methyltransferase TrmD [Thermodesulfobacteriota bacterium]
MSFEIITLFPEFFSSPLQESILGKALGKGLISIHIHDLRSFTNDRHRTADDYPYGGGAGMVLKPNPVVDALEAVSGSQESLKILLTPQGTLFSQKIAEEFARSDRIVLVCGRYEGFDERIRYFVDCELSIGDYVLNGGEAAALVVVEAVSRLVPGVLGKYTSATGDSFSHGLLEYPQYTRPECFRGHAVPDVLLSGNHQKIEQWRRRESLRRTLERRPDVLRDEPLSDEEKEWLKALKQQKNGLRKDSHECVRDC